LISSAPAGMVQHIIAAVRTIQRSLMVVSCR
jgi:hypothetical protein